MTHPSKEIFLLTYKKAATASLDWLLATFEESKQYPQYTLMTCFLARCISGKFGCEGETPSALIWADRALGMLDDKNTLSKAYGGDEDYLASVQACVVLKVRWLSLSEEHFDWYKAKDLAEDMLATGFPSIYIKNNASKDGIQLALMLMNVYNRLGEHIRAMHLGARIQSQAQQHQDAATECRASFNWAVAALLLSKQYSVDSKFTDAYATLDSSAHVLSTLNTNSDMRTLLGSFAQAVAGYAELLQTQRTDISEAAHQTAIETFVNLWDVDIQCGLLDIVQMHSSDMDDKLASIVVRNLEDVSDTV